MTQNIFLGKLRESKEICQERSGSEKIISLTKKSVYWDKFITISQTLIFNPTWKITNVSKKNNDYQK